MSSSISRRAAAAAAFSLERVKKMSEKKGPRSISRFTVVIIVAVVIAVINYLSYPVILDMKLATVAVPVAKHDLEPYHQLTADDLTYVQMPKTYLGDAMLTDGDALIGLYVRPEHTVTAGSFLYSGALCSAEQLTGQVASGLGTDGMALSLAVDDLSSTNDGLQAGQFVDLFFTGAKQEGGLHKAVVGLLCEHVALKAVYGPDSAKIDAGGHVRFVVVALSAQQLDYVMRAQQIGTVRPVLTDGAGRPDAEPSGYYSVARTMAFVDEMTVSLRSR